jgi:hypothetical protein
MRFHISGELWGAIEVRQDLVIRDITPDGALLEGQLPVRLRALATASLRLSADGPELLVRVRHVSALDGDRCRVGVQFVQLTSADRQALDVLIQSAAPSPGRSS